MRIAVIGPLEVLTDDCAPVAVPGAQERLLLAVLASAAPEVVSTDRLIEGLSDGSPPGFAREPLQVHVTRLRRALEPGQPPGSSGHYVLRRGAGYVLATGRADIDTLHLADLAGRGRARLAAGDAVEAERLLSAALALWRGEPYADWPDAAFAQEERRRLADVRTGAVAALVEAHRRLAEPARHLSGDDRVRPPPPPAPPRVGRAGSGPAAAARQRTRRRPTRGAGVHPAGLLAGALVAVLAVALVTARVTARSWQETEAIRLAALSVGEARLDRSFLLAALAFRLADTPRTRQVLLDTLEDHERVERAVFFSGAPEAPVLTGGAGTLTFGTGDLVVAWPVEPASRPQVVMGIPEEWGAWIVAAPSPAEDVVMAAGLGADGPWLRLLAPRDSTSRVLLEGEQVGGRPVDGAVSADGRRLLLVVAEPDAVRPDDAARWRLIEVDAIDATRRDTGIGGTVRVPAEGVRADVAADAGAVVVWDDTGTAPAMFVDVPTGRQTPIRAQQRPSASRGFRALPSGAAQFWHDGTVVLVDRAGTPVQELDAHTRPVEDVAVSPDGTWAVTAGDGAEVVRWEIESSTGRWVAPEVLAGHAAQVVGVEVDTSGRTLVTVSLDHTVIAWDMGPAGGRSTARPDDPAAWLAEACAVVGRDLTPAEWRHFLPALPWQATCTDGPVTQSPPGE